MHINSLKMEVNVWLCRRERKGFFNLDSAITGNGESRVGEGKGRGGLVLS